MPTIPSSSTPPIGMPMMPAPSPPTVGAGLFPQPAYGGLFTRLQVLNSTLQLITPFLTTIGQKDVDCCPLEQFVAHTDLSLADFGVVRWLASSDPYHPYEACLVREADWIGVSPETSEKPIPASAIKPESGDPIGVPLTCSYVVSSKVKDIFRQNCKSWMRCLPLVLLALEQFVDRFDCQVKREVTSNDTITIASIWTELKWSQWLTPNRCVNSLKPGTNTTSINRHVDLDSHYEAISTGDPVLLSLRSAVAEKLHRQQQKMVQRLTCEIEALDATDRDLNAGREKLDMYRAQIASELTQVKQITSDLEKKTHELREAYHKLKKEEENGQMNFDDVVSATAPVYRQ
ncbi:unnamed protein product [Schistocephalus solidus]|uniref:SWIRM-assoc_1 domain-containing protein n=1 Tax=Schistocephalus solidus TaxID=70667 RepID=A0A183TRQ4_SCHSO|nr:unnamed protein product [Schistocephalus solidus]